MVRAQGTQYGDYRLLRLLGEGGFAEVYEAEHVHLPGSKSRTMQEVAGTWIYMAPEQFRGRAEPASDQYAMAIMVYQWLTGNVPFNGK